MDQKSVYVSKLNTMTQKTQEKIQEKYELANKYLLSGDYDMALLQYEKVQFMSPKDPDVFLGKGKIYMALGDLKVTLMKTCNAIKTIRYVQSFDYNVDEWITG